jgi:hypothetical protein
MHYELDKALNDAIYAWSSERADALQEDEEIDPRVLELVEKIAEEMVKTSKEMIPTCRLQLAYSMGKSPLSALEEVDAREIATGRIQEMVAWEFCTSTAEMAARVLELSNEVVLGEPNEAVRRYLKRLSRAFVLGLFPECVMLCRSVLENALRQRFDMEEEMVKPDLKRKIQFARTKGWISEADAVSAHDVRNRGNTAVHNDPEVTAEVLDTIQKTMRVVRALRI